LPQAKVVIAGGRGVGSAENFKTVLEPLADVLGAAVGATRDAVDLGYYPGEYQIGQTGVTVSPDVYIGFGISGAIQHTSGMQTAKKVIVVNNDEDAPIFDIADLGVVGDLFDVAPALLEEINKRK
ncbi:electron transfer flavoprotein FAD-binding domain protein, partial [Corynebacterium efficiens YS-314]